MQLSIFGAINPLLWALGLGVGFLGVHLEAMAVGKHPGTQVGQVSMPDIAPMCTSEVCIQLAEELVKRTTANKTAVDLCEDLESFVCDDWRMEHRLRPDQGRISYDSVLQDRSNDVIRGFLDASAPPIDTPEDFASFELVKKAFSACINEAEVKRVGISPVARKLVELSDIFEVEDAAYSKLNSTPLAEGGSFGLAKALLYLEESGISNFVDIYVSRDDKNPATRIVIVSPPEEYTLPTDYYTDNGTMERYRLAMHMVLSVLHPSKAARDNAEQLAKQVIEFEGRLSALLPGLDDLYDVNKYYNILSLADTAKLAPVLGLDHVIRSLSPAHHSNARMITSFPEAIKSISDVVATTSRETLQTYLMWSIIDATVSAVLADEIEPWRNLKNSLNGRDPIAFPERWRTCVGHVSSMDTLGWILSRFYAAGYFSDKGKELGESLVTYVKQEYERTIGSLDWLDDSVKKVAKQKLEKLGALMGFPDKLPLDVRDPVAVLKFYSGVNITSSFFDNVWFLMRWTTANSWRKLPIPYDKGEWLMTSQTVNAYNDPSSNMIAFPAAILQVPYFHADIPSYLNFGATGWTVGHEVSHAFDNHGRAYDPDGAYGEDWWTNRTDAEFRRRSECFVAQYENYTVEGLGGSELHLDGRQTLGENIADAGGIDTAFLAWQRHRADHPEQDTGLPGLEGRWTHEQLYFIGFANSWCSAQTREALIQQVFSDEHAPAKFRVKGTLENSRYFKEHFGCASKEPTCKIW